MAAALFTKSDQFSCIDLLIAGCKGAILGSHHMVKKRILHFKECMIQEFCETMWERFPLVFPKLDYRKEGGYFYRLEVPGNRLPNTGSNSARSLPSKKREGEEKKLKNQKEFQEKEF
ncbi:hypothetical protein V6N13_055067 [Hibiscus sabdariffa]